MASDDPVVAVPMACLAEGACHRSAKIETPGANINKWIISRQATFGKLTTRVENLYICIYNIRVGKHQKITLNTYESPDIHRYLNGQRRKTSVAEKHRCDHTQTD